LHNSDVIPTHIIPEQSMTTSDLTTSSSLLVDWANQEAAWIRQVTADVLASKTRASDADISKYFELLLRESHLHSNAPIDVPLLPQSGPDNDSSETLRLTAMTIRGGVNALRDGETLEFGSKLTVVFGENGSGKSGYVRVLKRAAGVRSAEPVLGNVHQSMIQQPSVDVAFSLSGTNQQPLHWHNEEAVRPLTQIAVFDARAAGAHVDDELAYVYTPGELALFPLVQDALDRTRTMLTTEIARTTDARNPFLVHFKRGTTVYPLVEKLGAATDLGQLRALATLTDSESTRRVQLQTEVDALTSADLKAQLKLAADQSSLVRDVLKAIDAVVTFDTDTYRSIVGTLNSAEQKEKAVTSQAFAGSLIPGVLDDPWRRFVEAGEADSTFAIDRSDVTNARSRIGTFPSEHAECIYCRQPLAANAVVLIQKYREYASGQARRTLIDAQGKLEACCTHVTHLNLMFVEAAVKAEIAHGRGQTLSFLVEPLQIVAAFTGAVAARSTDLPTIDSLRAIRDTAEQLVAKLGETVTGLGAKAAERERLLAQRQAELAELDARTILAGLWLSIEKRVQEAKWTDGAGQVNRTFAATLRSLTEQAKVATHALLNTNFEQVFAEEARALRAPTVILQFPGARGQALRRKVVADHRPSEVLSEGEQKVVALADFLAETRVRQPHGPVIFDDPVNSLDFRRVREVAERISSLADTHQVVVFTHSVMFASMLLETADKKATKYIDVRNDGSPGIASVGTHPRTDSVSDLTKRIESRIAAAKAATGEVLESLLESAYGTIRALTEVITERGLLRAISARYRANVRVEGLEKLNTADMSAAITVVVEQYRKACRIIEAHSQPIEHLGVKATVAEVEADYTALKEILKMYPPVE
jgi:predicted ATPase